MNRVSPELEARMIALVRSYASRNCMDKEAQAIVAELPAPVDPDLAWARKFLGDVCENAAAFRDTDMAKAYREERHILPGSFSDMLAQKIKAARQESPQ